MDILPCSTHGHELGGLGTPQLCLLDFLLTRGQIEIEFKVTGNGNLYGDGFAIWLTKERAQQGGVFGFKDQFEGLGIFFDTYKNNRPGVVFPYVMAMVGDGQTSYDAAHDGKANEIAGCSVCGLDNGNTSHAATNSLDRHGAYATRKHRRKRA